MVDCLDGALVSLKDGLLNLRCRRTFSPREVEHGDPKILQVVILPYPIISDNEHVDVQFPHGLGVVQSTLRDHNVGVFEGFDDRKTLFERDDGRILVAGHQFIGADSDDEGVTQTASVFNHLEMVGMEHVERSGGIDDDSVVVHNYFCANYSECGLSY